mgnify:CR=1 FL=1
MPDEIIQENTRSKKWIWVSIAVLVVVAIVIIVLVAGPKKNSKQGDSSGLSGQGETFDPSFPPREYYQEPTALPGAPEGRMFLELASASADSRRPKPMASDEECAAGVLRPVGRSLWAACRSLAAFAEASAAHRPSSAEADFGPQRPKP